MPGAISRADAADVVVGVIAVVAAMAIKLAAQCDEFSSQLLVLLVGLLQLPFNTVHVSARKVALPQLVHMKAYSASLHAGTAPRDAAITSGLAGVTTIASLHPFPLKSFELVMRAEQANETGKRNKFAGQKNGIHSEVGDLCT